MLAHSLLSGALLLLPIAITVGIYIGIEFDKIFRTGFKGTYGVPETGFAPGGDGLQTSTYCQKLVGITPQGSRYTYAVGAPPDPLDAFGFAISKTDTLLTDNPNQWGLGSSDASRMCMNITTGTIDSGNTHADPWAVTWNYTQGPETQPVHAFPNALLEIKTLPKQISTISKVAIDVSWRYSLGNDNSTITTDEVLGASDLNANVAVDMFFDPSKSESSVTTKADYEVMIWLGKYGTATQPIGLDVGALITQSVNGTTFNLYSGANSAGQKVFTWVATVDTKRFVGDISPMLSVLSTHGGPTSADYLGYIGFGSEAYSSTQNVTFSVPELAIDVQ